MWFLSVFGVVDHEKMVFRGVYFRSVPRCPWSVLTQNLLARYLEWESTYFRSGKSQSFGLLKLRNLLILGNIWYTLKIFATPKPSKNRTFVWEVPQNTLFTDLFSVNCNNSVMEWRQVIFFGSKMFHGFQVNSCWNLQNLRFCLHLGVFWTYSNAIDSKTLRLYVSSKKSQ